MQIIGHKTYNLLFIINTAELFSHTMSVNCTYLSTTAADENNENNELEESSQILL